MLDLKIVNSQRTRISATGLSKKLYNKYDMFFICDIKGYDHAQSSKEEHHHKVGCAAPKRAFFQHATVSIGKYHVKKEVKSKSAKK